MSGPGPAPSGTPSSAPSTAPATTTSVPQLPPQMFTTAASLLDLSDKKLVTVLRDGRKLIGVLRSWDQFGNLLLSDAVERVFTSSSGPGAAHLYADVAQGLYLVRGENVMLMGEVDLDRDEHVPAPWTRGDTATVVAMQKRENEERRLREGRRRVRKRELGFEAENAGEAIL